MALMTALFVTVFGSLVEGGRRLVDLLVADMSLLPAPVADPDGVEAAWRHRMFRAMRVCSRGDAPALRG